MLIIPTSLKILGDFDKKQVAEIVIKYKNVEEVDVKDYDEDEQLYNAMKLVKYPNYNIPIYKFNGNFVIIIPHISNTIVINKLSEVLVNLDIKSWITLAPSNIPQSLNQVGILDFKLPHMKPPHFITGISASINSNLYKKGKKFVGLILRGEGQPGFEIIDGDAMVDVAYVLESHYHIDLVKHVSTKVRKFTYSGMYI